MAINASRAKIEPREAAIVVQETVAIAITVSKCADNLAGIIDARGNSEGRPWDIKGRETTSTVGKSALVAETVMGNPAAVVADNVPDVINSEEARIRCFVRRLWGEVNGSHRAVAVYECGATKVDRARVSPADYCSVVVDRVWIIRDFGNDAICVPEAVTK